MRRKAQLGGSAPDDECGKGEYDSGYDETLDLQCEIRQSDGSAPKTVRALDLSIKGPLSFRVEF